MLVPGLGRYMELKAMARQQRQTLEAVEDKVFMRNPKVSLHCIM